MTNSESENETTPIIENINSQKACPITDDDTTKEKEAIPAREILAESRYTQTDYSNEDTDQQENKTFPVPEKAQIRINTIKGYKINSVQQSTESSSTEDDTPQRKPKPKEKATHPPENMDFKSCLKGLLSHTRDYLWAIGKGLLLVLAWILHHYLGDHGIKLLIFLFIVFQSLTYLELYQPTGRVNKLQPREQPETPDQTKTIYDKLNIPTRNKLKLSKKVQQFRNARSKVHQHKSSDLDDSLLIEEPVELPSYPTKVPAHSKFVIKGSVNDIPVVWEVDTGSCITLISTDIFDRIPNSSFLPKTPLTVTYADFQGTTVKAIGKYNLTVRLGENVITTQEIVVIDHPDKSQPHALIGVDMVRSKRLGVDVKGNAKAYLSFLVGSVVKRLELQTIQDCFVAQNSEIGGGEAGFVHLSLLNNINKICLQNQSQITNAQGEVNCPAGEGYTIPTVSLCSLDNTASFTLPIQNKQFGPLTFFKGQKLGSFSPLQTGTLLQSTSNVFETIGHNSKASPSLGTTILKLSETLQQINTNKVLFVQHKDQLDSAYIVSRANPDVNVHNSQIKIQDMKILIPPFSARSELDEWRSVFHLLKNKTVDGTSITLDYSTLRVDSANLLQVAFHEVFQNNQVKLQLVHKDLRILKTKVVSEESEESSQPSEDDLCESIFQTRRISSTEETWTSLLKHVPTHLRLKTFHLLTTKYPDVIAKSPVDFGECTLPNSHFKIELHDNSPITCRPYPLNVVYESFVNETIRDMVDAGLLIEEASSYGTGKTMEK